MLTFSNCAPLTRLTFIVLNFLFLLNQVTGGGDYFQSTEQILASEFRSMIKDIARKDYMLSEGYILRWLEVYDFDLEKTLEKFKQSMQWRRNNNIDNILNEDFSAIDELYPFAVEGVDKDGRPIAWAPVGTFDIRKIVIAGDQELYQRYMMRMYELMEIEMHRLRQTTGRDNITQAVVIFDLAGFNVKTGGCFRCLSMVPEFMSNADNNYPNVFYRAYHVNTPALFESVYRIAKNILSAKTQEAVQIFDYNKDKWIAALLGQIPADQLPVRYGGTRPVDYYTLATQRKQLISSIIEFGNSDSHLSSTTSASTREAAAPAAIEPVSDAQSISEEQLEDHKHHSHSHHTKEAKEEHVVKGSDTELTVNSISRRHMESSDMIVETIPKEEVSSSNSSSPSALVVSSSLNQRSISDHERAPSSTELPPFVLRHHCKHHHHHYQDVESEHEMRGGPYKSLPYDDGGPHRLRSGANTNVNLISQFSTIVFTCLVFVFVLC